LHIPGEGGSTRIELKIAFIVFTVLILFAIAFFSYGFLYEKYQAIRYGPVLVEPKKGADMNILFLSHSTGTCIWNGGVESWFQEYNEKNGTDYSIKKQDFPKMAPYGWGNYPYDYWNIWVKQAGDDPYMREPTLEMIAQKYDVIVLKHCFPGSAIQPDKDAPDVSSSEKTLENYKAQYTSLKEKFVQFPDLKFIVWTNPALVKNVTNESEAIRAQEFYRWVMDTWDESGDNIFIFDFRHIETGGSLYLPESNAVSSTNSHPNEEFSKTTAPIFCQRIVEVINS
jgi:hypothetical protein